MSTIRFLLAASVIVLGSTFVNGSAFAESDVDNTAAEASSPKTGHMIDQMMNQEALADAASAIITAESALPKKTPENAAGKDDMDSAVKMALAKIPDSKFPPTQGSEASQALQETTAAAPSAESENQQPLFNNEVASTKMKKASSSSQIWWRMVGSLAIVLVVFGGGVYGFKKWPGAKKMTSRGRMIEVMSQHHLGPKRSLAVVRVAGEACLIGITDQNITILKTLSLLDDDIPATAATMKNASPDAGNSKNAAGFSSKFQETLAATFTRSSGKGAALAASQAPARASEKAERAEPAFYNRSAKAATGNASGQNVAQDLTNEDEFTMQGLREIVGEKLKSMREI